MARPDFGRHRASDIGDVGPAADATLDTTGLVSHGTNPVSGGSRSICCALADRAMSNAMKALEQAERALQAMKDIANKQKPQTPNKCGGPCTARVIVTVRRCDIVRKPGGQISTGLGASGQMIGSTVVGTICYTFNSAIAAKAFADGKRAAAEARNVAFGYTIPKVYEFTPQFESNDLGGCPEPAEDKRAMVGKQINLPPNTTVET